MKKQQSLISKCLVASLSVLMLAGLLLPVGIWAEEMAPPSESCREHTRHDEGCDYVEGVEGVSCAHEHNAECGYSEKIPEAACDMECSEIGEDGNIVHQEGCSYSPEVVGTPCSHEHDSECGYIEAIEAVPCSHSCELFVPEEIPMPVMPIAFANIGSVKNLTAAQNLAGTQVYMGNYTHISLGNNPIAWRVVAVDGGTATLLSEYLLDGRQYDSDGHKNWSGSEICRWLNSTGSFANNGFYANSFFAGEKSSIVQQYSNAEETTGGYTIKPNQAIVLPSIAEVNAWFTSQNFRKGYGVDGGGPYFCWLRSPGGVSDTAAIVSTNGAVVLGGSRVSTIAAVRPVLKLDLSSVLFTSDASGAKPAGGGPNLTAAKQPTGAAKLTVISEYNSSTNPTGHTKPNITITGVSGRTVVFSYSGATAGPTVPLSAVVVNSEGTVKYYGQLVAGTSNPGSGTGVKVTVPDDFAPGDKLQVFTETLNGDKQTDYCSKPVTLSVNNQTAPTGLTAVNTSIAGLDGKINGTTTEMEYKLVSENSWISVSSASITGLAPGEYQVRYKAKSVSGTYTIASPAASLRVNQAVNWNDLTSNGIADTADTTELTLTFDKDPAGLTAADITVTGAVRGNLSGSGTTRTLSISNISVGEGETVTVAITNPSGLAISPSSKTVEVHKDTRTYLSWTNLTSNGIADTADTTELTLTFDKDPAGLTAADITVTGAVRGDLSGSGTTRTLSISNISVGEGEAVTVTITNPSGLIISPLSKTVEVHKDTRTHLSWTDLTPNGIANTADTTELTLTFDKDPAGLTAADITVTGAVKGDLSGSGTTRTLSISNISVGEGETVTVAITNPSGLIISPLSKTVEVHKDTRTYLSWTDLTPNGIANTADTTELTLTFDKDPAGLTAADITVTGAVKGNLSGSGTTRTLSISNISVGEGEAVTVAIANPSGLFISPLSKTVEVHRDTRTAPVFNTHPVNVSKTAGETAAFSVTVGGNPEPELQWQVSIDNGNSWTDLSGENSDILTLHNLTLDMNGNLYRCLAKNSKQSDVASAEGTLTVIPRVLSGTLTINKTSPVVADELFGTLTGSNNTGTLAYVWKVAGVQVSTAAVYTVAAADVGKVITLTISSSVETGDITSSPTNAVAKRPCAASPVEPQLLSKTHTSVSLKPVTGYEYSKDGTNWQTSNVFTGLTEYTNYTFYQRIAATVDTLASAISVGLKETTEDAPLVMYSLHLSASPAAGGNVTGAGSFAANTSQTVIAMPAAGYEFVSWTENGTVVSESASYTFQLTFSKTLVACFKEKPASTSGGETSSYSQPVSSRPPSSSKPTTSSFGSSSPASSSSGIAASSKPASSSSSVKLPDNTFTPDQIKNKDLRFTVGEEFSVLAPKDSLGWDETMLSGRYNSDTGTYTFTALEAGEATLTYIDEQGNTTRLTLILEEAALPLANQNNDNGFFWGIILLVILVIAAACVVVIVLVKRAKNRNLDR